ncbi:hypothetical protein [Streptomyces sp. NPDC015345]|uniref:hypothetical protein n=1 Tax=Streptomyces sp. NPDC015345 TaxID=3364953 RepID=UPI0036FBCA70
MLAATGLDDWAREKALPSEEEIARVKHLIARVEDDLDQLTDTERHELEEAITLVRRSRRVVSLGMPHVRQPSPDLRLERPRPRKPRESCRHAAPSSTGTVTSSA